MRALAFEGQAIHSFPRKATCRPSRDGVSLEYASLPTKTSSSQTSSTTPSRHLAINHNCPPRPYIFILLPRMAVRRVPDLPCTFVFLRHVPVKAMTSLCRSTTPLRHFTSLPNLPRRSLLQPIPRAALPFLLPLLLRPQGFMKRRLISDATAQDPLRSPRQSPSLTGLCTGINTQNGMHQVSIACFIGPTDAV